MRKLRIILLSMGTLGALSINLSSCKKDESPVVNPKLSVALEEDSFKESDGTVEVGFALDKAASADITVQYSFTGSTADEKSTVNSGDAYDFEDLNEGEVTIKKGEKTGTIELKMYPDLDFEDNELIDIKIDNVSSTNIDITRVDETKITLVQEDGIIVYLEWPPASEDGFADMDLIIRYVDNTTTWADILTGSAYRNSTPGEFAFIPKSFGESAFGASYVYYKGNLNPLDFTVQFIEFTNGQFEANSGIEEFPGQYTTENINTWTTATIGTTKVVQTFSFSGSSFGDISDIVTPSDGGSRVSTMIETSLKKNVIKGSTPREMPAKLKAWLKK